MAAHSKAAHELARQLFKLSLVNGNVSPERVAGVLEYVEKDRPANPVIVLKAYHRLIAAELARERAIVEHAGMISDAVLQAIAAEMGRRYRRTVAVTAQSNPALIAGLRVRIGDDIYESSIASQLEALAASV